MMKILLVLSLLAATGFCAQYAVLVAGSNGWYNYRHQSDVCHSYHILRNNGIPASNIIVLAYDDIANSPSNPLPGTIYNKPSGAEPGFNVYAGCVIDYKGNDVTAANWLAVITGNNQAVKGGNGRVLESGPDDEVFLYYSDHGSVGLIAFPVGPYLYANDQLKALQTMYDNKMFKQLTYYLEACESGSMFQQLPTNTNVYGVSASNPTESSWATYCPPDDQVNGKHIGTCLGDEFSVNWMENTEAVNPSTFTLQQQFTAVSTATVLSEVMQWGDVSFTNLPIGNFQGSGKKVNFLDKVLRAVNLNRPARTGTFGKEDSRDAKVNYLLRSFNAEPTNDSIFLELTEEIALTRKFTVAIDSFAAKYKISGVYYGSTNFDCYSTTINNLIASCGQVNDASMRYFKYLYQYCAMYTYWQGAQFTC